MAITNNTYILILADHWEKEAALVNLSDHEMTYAQRRTTQIVLQTVAKELREWVENEGPLPHDAEEM